MMKKILFIAIVLTTSATLFAQPKLVDEVIAVVGDKIVLMSEVEIQYMQYQQQEQSLPPDFRCRVIDQLMTEKMLLTQAEADSVNVGVEEVEMEMDRRIRYFVNMLGSEEKLEEYYNKSILEIKDEFREDVRSQLLAQRMQTHITGDVKVTPNEVKEFFENLPQDSLPYFDAEVQVGQIVIYAEPSEATKKEARQELVKIKEKIASGLTGFKTQAILYSDDPGTASEGGDLPPFSRSDPYVPEFIGAAFKLSEPGEVSDIIETEFGYHIIQLIEKRGQKVQVRHILKRPKITEADLERAREKLYKVHKMLENGELTFSQAVAKFSQDERTENTNGLIRNPQTGETKFEFDQLGAFDADLPFIIDNLQVGEFSKPKAYVDQQQKQAFRIIYLKTQTDPHIANLKDDYSKIKEVTLAQKKDKAMQDWMAEKIEKTYIKLDPKYSDCKILDLWTQTNP